MTIAEQGVETVVRMPSLGESVDVGTITRWLKQPGERIAFDEPLLEVATDKVDTEIPAPCGGILNRILAEENDVVAVGAELAVITIEAGVAPEPTPPESVEVSVESFVAPVTSPTVAEQPDDVQPATEKLTRLRRTIARRMVESLQVAAQLTSVVEVDLTTIARLRAAHKDEFLHRTGGKLSYLPFFAKAATEALAVHRMLNASLNADVTEVTYHSGCHLGIAVDSPKGLMVPVIRDADGLTIPQLASAIADLADKVRTGTITADELTGGTFTLTNTGSRGALFDTPIISQPQTGILGTGAVVERLVPIRDDEDALRIEARSMAYLSLSYDHRIVDGADAARFLTHVKRRLEGGFTRAELMS